MAIHTADHPTHWFGRTYDRKTNAFSDMSEFECIEILASILKNGFKLSNCKERLPIHQDIASEEKIDATTFGTDSPMICFTDIPFDKSDFHRSKYGSWGIEMNRKWIIENGGQPVIYRSAGKNDELMRQIIRLSKYLYCEPEKKRKFRAALDNNPVTKDLYDILDKLQREFLVSSKHIEHEVFSLTLGNFREREWRVGSRGQAISHIPFEADDVVTIYYQGSEATKTRIESHPDIINKFAIGGIQNLIDCQREDPPKLRRRK